MKAQTVVPALLAGLIFLGGCSAGRRPLPEASQEPSYPLENFPESSEEDTIDPFAQPEMVVISARLPAGPAPAGKDTAPDAVLVEDELLALINQARAKEGLSLLESEEAILNAARLRSRELQESFSHSRPDGSAYYTAFDEVGFSYLGIWHGENASCLRFPQGEYSEEEIARLMYEDLSASPGNYRNMMRSQYGRTGVGVVVSAADGETNVTSSQLFAGK